MYNQNQNYQGNQQYQQQNQYQNQQQYQQYPPNQPYQAYPNPNPQKMPIEKQPPQQKYLADKNHQNKQINIQKDYEIQPQNNNVDNPHMYYGSGGGSIFSDDVIRQGFVRKVLSIIGCQFIITTIFVIVSVVSESYNEFTRENIWLLVVCFIVNIIVLIALYCFRNNCKQVPRNYILLFIYTISESYLISCISGTVEPGVVLLATIILVVLVFSLVLYALKTKNDITQKITFFIYAPFALIVIIIVASAFTSYIVQTIVSLIIIAFFSAYLVFDIQRLTNPQKKNKFTYSLDDYIIAALDIYIDIVMIFQELLLLLAR